MDGMHHDEREWTIAELAEAMKDLPPAPVSP